VSENELVPPFPTQVVTQGKVTIPYNIRKKLDLKTGDWVLIQILKVERQGRDKK